MVFSDGLFRWSFQILFLIGFETYLFEVDKRVGFGYLSQEALNESGEREGRSVILILWRDWLMAYLFLFSIEGL